ncbi:dihydroxy-acid dehydratase [Cognatiyoonia koreensis]|uniref:dihydroxy-acid dehydratase n=1 Tax=Cognatiyoonia koreensis TaxID=364200 RepID=UPI001F617D7F|nr:dihydroxy-acid dehydratase [Cognatiyoonia koreensis]
MFSIALAMALAGCDGLDFGGQAAPVKRAALLGGAVGVQGPEGYCVDINDSRLVRGFAILAPCATLGLSGAVNVSRPAVITVQAGRIGTAAITGSEPAFAGLLETPAGAALLSRSGDPATVEIIETGSSANKVTVYFEDKEGTPVPGTQNREWRAFVDINGRLVTISARGLQVAPLAAEAGKGLLNEVVAAMMNANAA